MQFITKNSVPTNTLISCNTNEIVEVFHLGLEINNALSQNVHTDSVINKLTTVCFMIRLVRPHMSHSSLLKIYYSVSFYIITWYYILGAGYLHQETLFDTKKAVCLITGYGNRFSCRNLFR
jgi:hypothetical protein